jgi:hypothetical protein
MRRIRKKRRVRRLHGLVLGAALALAIGIPMAAVGHSSTTVGGAPPAAADPSVPSVPRDSGAGEHLLLVVGGTYDTRAEAEASNQADQAAFGDLQGYYVVPVAAFQGFKDGVGSPGDWALVSAFRTPEGAAEFSSFATSVGVPANVVGPVVSRGTAFAGLGQEEDPSGRGPLTHPLPPAQQAALR